MAKWVIGLAVAVVLTGVKMVSHPTLAATPDGRARDLAATLNAAAPMPLGAHATLTGARPDGNVVEMDIRLAADAPLGLPSDAFRRMFMAATCRQSASAAFIDNGGAIRYAMITADGRGIDPVTIATCPATTG